MFAAALKKLNKIKLKEYNRFLFFQNKTKIKFFSLKPGSAQSFFIIAFIVSNLFEPTESFSLHTFIPNVLKPSDVTVPF